MISYDAVEPKTDSGGAPPWFDCVAIELSVGESDYSKDGNFIPGPETIITLWGRLLDNYKHSDAYCMGTGVYHAFGLTLLVVSCVAVLMSAETCTGTSISTTLQSSIPTHMRP